jgi:hypothetical protein
MYRYATTLMYPRRRSRRAAFCIATVHLSRRPPLPGIRTHPLPYPRPLIS